MNPHTSHAAVLRRRYAHYGNSHANGRRTSTENTNDNSSTSTRRRSIRLAAEATAGAGGRGGGGVDARGIPVHLQRTLEAAAYTQAGLLRASSLQIPESVCASCYRGKVRDTYTLRDGRLLMVATDRASAFDRHVGCIPFKRCIPDCHLEILDGHCERETRLRNTAMEESPSSRTSSAATDVMVDPNLTVMRRVTPLPFEMVVREYMSRSKTTTSLWHAYQRANRRFCGHEVPEDRLRCRQRNGSSIT